MLRSLFPLLTVVLATVSSAGLASTDGEGFESAGWIGAPQYRDGQFEHCAMMFENEAGELLTVALNPDGDVGIGVRSRDWRLPVGMDLPFTYRVGHTSWVSGTARALSADAIIAWFDGPEFSRHLRALGQTGRMSLEVADAVIGFSLPRTRRPTNALVECVQTVLDGLSKQRARRFIEMFRLR